MCYCLPSLMASQAVQATGANPVSVDVNPNTGLMSLEDLKLAMTKAQKR